MSSKHLLTMLKYSFAVTGILLESEHREYEKYFVACFVTFVISGGTAIFVIFNQVTAISEKTEVVYALFGAMCVGLVFLTFQHHKSRLRDIYFRVERMYGTNADDAFTLTSNRICAEIVSKYKTNVIYMVVITFTIPPMIATLTKVPLGDLRTLIIPSWYPWTKTTRVGYSLTIAAQVFTMLAAYSLLVSVVAFVTASAIAIYANYEILREKLCALNANSWEYELKHMIEHHRHLMDFSEEVKKLAVNFVNVLLFTVFGEVVSLISVFVQVEKDYLYKLKLLSACSIMMWAFFSYCVVGEILVNLKDEIKYTLYSTPWYKKDVKTRKTILMFMILNKNPITLKAFNMYHIDLPFSLAIARKCYAVVQFLQTAVL